MPLSGQNKGGGRDQKPGEGSRSIQHALETSETASGCGEARGRVL